MAANAIELAEARRQVLARAAQLPAEPVGLRQALGRVLAEDVLASEPVQGFDNSAMDGYALRAKDTASGWRPRASCASRLPPASKRPVACRGPWIKPSP